MMTEGDVLANQPGEGGDTDGPLPGPRAGDDETKEEEDPHPRPRPRGGRAKTPPYFGEIGQEFFIEPVAKSRRRG